jgi:hypothetical protein
VVPSDIEIGFPLCEAGQDVRACWTAKGVSGAAVEFILALDPGGQTFATSFRELGKVDLAMTEFNGASPVLLPVLLNSNADLLRISGLSRDELVVFEDGTSQEFLRSNRAHWSSRPSVNGLRMLPNGNQRFIITHPLHACRACQNDGVAVVFLDFEASGMLAEKTDVGIVAANLGQIAGYALERPSLSSMRNEPALLQFTLNSLGFNAGEMDGYPGPQTRQALMQFKAEHCLPVTGQPDSATLNAVVAADGFSSSCAGTSLAEGISANTPMQAGVYVSNSEFCSLPDIPDAGHDQAMRLVEGTRTGFGYHQTCETRRTDIRADGTLFRGNCSESLQTWESRWTFDIQSARSFIEVSRDGTPSQNGVFSLCDAQSPLHQTWANWFTEAIPNTVTRQEAIQTSEGYFEPERGSQMRTDLLDTVRADATELYGPPVEFVVGTLRVAGDIAFANLYAQRPGGARIDFVQTPGFARGDLPLDPGDPDSINAFLQRDGTQWRVTDFVVGATEAWWLDNCARWQPLFPQQCSETGGAPPGVASAAVTQPAPADTNTDLSSSYCAAVSPALTETQILDAIDNRTLYGRNPENGQPWKWRFENLSSGNDGISYFESESAADTLPTRVAGSFVCEQSASERDFCETIHTCLSGEVPLLTRSEFGDWTKADMVFPNAPTREEWQHFADLVTAGANTAAQPEAGSFGASQPSGSYTMDTSILGKLRACTQLTRAHLRIECLNSQQF